jgi:hypothetical protein
MLQALLQAELEAVLRAQLGAGLRAKTPPSPSGSLPAPLSTQPTSPGSGLASSTSGFAVIRKGQETPLHPPYRRRRGDKRHRQANAKPQVEYWRELLAYIDSAYTKKFGRHYPWSNLARKNLWNLARLHSAWRVMALGELYLESDSAWARRTGWSVYGMIRDTGRLMDDSRFKQLAVKHEDELARWRKGRIAGEVKKWHL